MIKGTAEVSTDPGIPRPRWATFGPDVIGRGVQVEVWAYDNPDSNEVDVVFTDTDHDERPRRSLSPDAAREMARQLMAAADEAEG